MLTSEPPFVQPSQPISDPRVPRWLAPLFADQKSMIIGAVGLGTVLLLLAGGAVLLLRRRSKRASAHTTAALPGQTAGEAADPAIEGATPELQKQLDPDGTNQFKLPPVTTQKTEILIKEIRERIHKDSAATVNVLRTWLAEKDTGEPA